jgi:hypothetical protein
MLNATFQQRCELASEEGQHRIEISRKIEALQPVEIIGSHWIHRPPEDADATFYRRDEVDEILEMVKSRARRIDQHR